MVLFRPSDRFFYVKIKVREPESRHSMMSRDIIDNGGAGPAAGAGDNNPTSDFTGAAA